MTVQNFLKTISKNQQSSTNTKKTSKKSVTILKILNDFI